MKLSMANRVIYAAAFAASLLIPDTSLSAQNNANCRVQHDEPSDAAKALSREDYPAALELYRKMATSDPDQSKSGVILTLLGQNKLKESEDLAQAWVKAEPDNADATETLGEVFFREAELGDVKTMMLATQKLDPCHARNYLLASQLDSIMANFKSSKDHIDLAYKLEPDDIDIREAWIDTLPRDLRLEQEKSLLKEPDLLSPDEKKSLEKEVKDAALPKDECKLVTPVTQTKIAIKSGTYAIGMPVKFNGTTRILQVDTGASGITLSRLGAVGLGLVREDTSMIGGIGDSGNVKSSIAHVASLKVGDLEFRDCRVDIIEKYEALDDVLGLIGMDVFRNFLITLDIGREKVNLEPLPKRPDEKAPETQSLATTAPTQMGGQTGGKTGEGSLQWHNRYIAPEMADWTQIFRIGHNVMVPVQLNDKINRLFIMDTGSSALIISTAAAQAVTKVRYDPRDSLTGLSGQVSKIFATGKFKLSFGELFQPIESITAVDTSKISHDVGLEVSGFLGMPVLHSLILHIDYRDNLIKFERGPDPW
jgi:tetratricopeptide (TPR) repeat protein